MSDEDTEIGDIDPDDAHAEGDAEVDWSHVDTVARQIADIDTIEGEYAKTEAAKVWAAELGGQ